ncbi:hypothetical protein TPELB_14140 [Terrisporobacter petrolearius]|uniref:Apea-like HEPN domain-containing protein n=1 Tax=Terrisporobacter petrolearius TaxID=1460447 RepID=A0ABZ3FBD3_9FIRM
MYIIKFVLVNNNVCIKDNYDYLETKVEKIAQELGFNDDKYFFNELEICDYVIQDNYTDFCLSFSYDDNEYDVYFTFATYNDTKQLEIAISSDIKDEELTYRTINKSKNFIEQLKICLKNNIMYKENTKKKKDWEKCVWLLDKQSELYATNLYPKAYKAENLLRAFINNVMIKVYGLNWTKEVLPEKMISNEKMYRGIQYKSIVNSLKDVDETLMSFDTNDLIKILKLTFYEWKCEKSNIIEKKLIALKGRIEQTKILKMEQDEINSIDTILNNLILQVEEDGNLWDEYFSNYLDDNFYKEIEIFSKNRNHIAHNKLVDRQAYESIKTNIDFISASLDKAIEKFSSDYKSLEMNKLEKMVDGYDDYIEQLMEEASGVNINNTKEILNIFENGIEKLYEEISDRLRFRADVETEIYMSVRLNEDDEKSFFKIYSLVTKEEIDINCIASIDDSQGEVSELNIVLKYNGETIKNYTITYTNGAISYDSEQCTYMPEIEDKIDEEEFNECIDNIVYIVDDKLENIREKIDCKMYSIIKDGGDSPVADSICCLNCGEEYICVNEEYGEIGQCLNCGEINDIYKCETCGNYVDELTELDCCHGCAPKEFFED